MKEKLRNSKENDEIEFDTSNKNKDKKEKLNLDPKYPIIMVIIILIIGIIFIYKIFISFSNPEKSNLKLKLNEENRRCIILGFGPVPQTLIPILVKNLNFKEYIIIEQKKIDAKEMEKIFKIGDPNKKIKYTFINKKLEYKKLSKELNEIIKDNDVVFDLFSLVSNIEVIKVVSSKKNTIYLDAGLEDQLEEGLKPMGLNEYNFKQLVNVLGKKGTYISDTGANPGMITHFAKLAIINMAKEAINKKVKDSNLIKKYLEKNDFKNLAKQLEVHTIHISEKENMEVNDLKTLNGFIFNSWSVSSFIEEYFIEFGEVSLGTMDEKFFKENKYIIEDFNLNPKMVSLPNKNIYLKTASPFEIFTGKVVQHPEVIEISELFSDKDHNVTVAFVYCPSKITRNQFKNNTNENFENNNKPRRSFIENIDGPLRGYELMGATLISARNDIPSRWYGSFVTCEESRRVGALTNPTTLQVGAGLYSHLVYALENPNLGLIWPGNCDSNRIMELASPYLGIIYNINLPFKMPYQFEKLLSKEENINDQF